MTFKFVDLFCGAGGFSNGLEQAGGKCILGVDNNKAAIETFKYNHKNAKYYLGDIEQLSEKELLELIGDNKIDAVVGGPPCQGFSTAGKGDINDPRNKLFHQFVRVVDIIKPKIIVFENVTGLVANKNKEVLNAIISSFESRGYTVGIDVFDSSEFGVASRRRRVIIIATHKGRRPLSPRKSTNQAIKTVGDVIGDLKGPDSNIYNHDIKDAAISNPVRMEQINKIPEGKCVRYQRDQEAYLPERLWIKVNINNEREKRLRENRLERLDRSKTCPTIPTSKYRFYHPVEDRYLTVRELARIQSFPNQFKFFGSYADQYRQIGNSVPPLLSNAVGGAIKKILNSNIKERKKEKFMNASVSAGSTFFYK